MAEPRATSATRARGRHLVLVGMMGAGKTTAGARCAQRLDRPFLDSDALVEAQAGSSVAEIFAAEGEAGFRARERAVVADACASPEPLVIACGGGAVLDPENRRRLREAGTVVWLRASPASLGARVAAGAEAGAGRPLLSGDTDATLERLALVRAATYASVADETIDTDDRSPDEVASAVLVAFAASTSS